jgi:hypothetical protein
MTIEQAGKQAQMHADARQSSRARARDSLPACLEGLALELL